MNTAYMGILQLIVEIIIFLIMVGIGNIIYKRVLYQTDLLAKTGEILPEDEIYTLKQVFYLIMMSLAFVDILYSVITGSQYIYFAVFDIALSVFFAVTLDKSSLKGKLILLLLVPFDSLNFFMFQVPMLTYIDIIHVLVFIYFIKVYYTKFQEYTESNGLSITILILFAIVFISFIVTQIVEGVNALDALVMVSNAFTSNGYAILGKSIPGKLNAIILVWGGYILSGVGTATLASAILMKHFHHKFDEMEQSNKELKESIKNLEEYIKNNGFNPSDDENS